MEKYKTIREVIEEPYSNRKIYIVKEQDNTYVDRHTDFVGNTLDEVLEKIYEDIDEEDYIDLIVDYGVNSLYKLVEDENIVNNMLIERNIPLLNRIEVEDDNHIPEYMKIYNILWKKYFKGKLLKGEDLHVGNYIYSLLIV